MSESVFVDSTIERVPEAASTIQGYLTKDDSLYMLVSDLRELAEAWFNAGYAERLERLLNALEAGLTEGDDLVRDAVAESFVWESDPWAASSQAFTATWPRRLGDEAERQLASMQENWSSRFGSRVYVLAAALCALAVLDIVLLDVSLNPGHDVEWFSVVSPVGAFVLALLIGPKLPMRWVCRLGLLVPLVCALSLAAVGQAIQQLLVSS